MTKSLRLGLALVAAGLLGSAAVAQPGLDRFPELRVGQTLTGSLSASQPSLSHFGPFNVYRIEVGADARYVAELKSSAFDAFLHLLRPVGGITESLDGDDDGGDGSDARLRIRVDQPGTYLLLATSYGSDASGPYTISLSELPPPRPATAHSITIGQTVEGHLAGDSAILETDHESEVPYDLYQVEVQAGQQLLITMDSDELDSYLEFGPMRDEAVSLVTDYDDDGGDGYNARLRVTVPAAGTYGIHARSFGEGSTGAYRLAVTEWVPAELISRALSPGREHEAHLTGDEAEIERGTPAHQWTFAGRAGQQVRVRMRSDEFDTYLLLGQLVNGEFLELSSNDDAPDDGTNSLIEHRLPADGEYALHATSLFGGRAGAYTLELVVD